MATATYVQKGDNIDYTASASIGYMEVVPLTARIGIALEAMEKGDTGTVTLTGVFKLPAAAGALTVGEEVYWDTKAGNVTGTKGDTTVFAGYTVEEKTESGATVNVRIG